MRSLAGSHIPQAHFCPQLQAGANVRVHRRIPLTPYLQAFPNFQRQRPTESSGSLGPPPQSQEWVFAFFGLLFTCESGLGFEASLTHCVTLSKSL